MTWVWCGYGRRDGCYGSSFSSQKVFWAVSCSVWDLKASVLRVHTCSQVSHFLLCWQGAFFTQLFRSIRNKTNSYAPDGHFERKLAKVLVKLFKDKCLTRYIAYTFEELNNSFLLWNTMVCCRHNNGKKKVYVYTFRLTWLINHKSVNCQTNAKHDKFKWQVCQLKIQFWGQVYEW